jgi:hypothetical protein
VITDSEKITVENWGTRKAAKDDVWSTAEEKY